MKNLILLLSLAVVFASSCKKDEETINLGTKTLYNFTDYEVKLSHSEFNYMVNPWDSVIVDANKPITKAAITTEDSTSKKFDVNLVDGSYVVDSFNEWGGYIAKNDSGSIDITYTNYNGETFYGGGGSGNFYPLIEKPISGLSMFVRCENKDGGTVEVEIYYKDQLIASNECSSLGCEALAESKLPTY